MVIQEKQNNAREDLGLESIRPEVVARGFILRDDPDYIGDGFAKRLATLLYEEWTHSPDFG